MAAMLVALIHVMLAVLLLAGLALHIERRRESTLAAFNITPPPLPERPAVQPTKPRVSTPSAKANPPKPKPPAPAAKLQSIAAEVAAPVASQGAPGGAGASGNGAGDGAGGSGKGGGGGVTGAQLLLSGALDRRDYRHIVALGPSRGAAQLLLLVNPAGRVERCRALESSGNPAIDATLCQMLIERARFIPTHGQDGATYYQDVRYFPRWGR